MVCSKRRHLKALYISSLLYLTQNCYSELSMHDCSAILASIYERRVQDVLQGPQRHACCITWSSQPLSMCRGSKRISGRFCARIFKPVRPRMLKRLCLFGNGSSDAEKAPLKPPDCDYLRDSLDSGRRSCPHDRLGGCRILRGVGCRIVRGEGCIFQLLHLILKSLNPAQQSST